jgi:hypothetical protein
MPVHERSAAWLASMDAETRRLHPDLGAYPYGYAVQFVDRTTPRVQVAFDYDDESDVGPYPFTASTPVEPASDRHAFMLDRDACVLYELFDADWNGGAPTAGSGAIFDLRSNALRPSGWTSADAAGLPIYPGLLRYDEVFGRGLVDHAIRFTASRTDRSFVWPARHQAGAAVDPSLPPMGARFRLRADFDATRYSPGVRVVLRAFQHYGLVLADNGSSFFFQGTQDARWPESFISELKTIPAAAFEAVDASSLMLDPDTGQVTATPGLKPGWHSSWQGQSAYLRMAPGTVAEFWIRFSNVGTEAWQRGVWGRQANLGLRGDDKTPYRLGMAADWLWDDRLATTTAAVVAPGEVGEFRFKVRAPLGRGTYRLELRPVIDGTTWLEDQGVYWLIVVE